MKKVSNNPLVSVIVPVYKVEEFLDKCVKSIVNQTYKNLEIILVDDGSPDNCPKMCNEWKKKDKRIKVIHKENGGLSDARNVGTEYAKGQFISYIDSDDFVSHDYIEYLYSLITKNKDVSFASCGVQIIREGDKIVDDKIFSFDILDSTAAYTSLLYDNGLFLSAWGKLFKSSFIKKFSFPKGVVYEDTAVIYKWIDQAKCIANGNHKCYYYYYRSNSISTQKEFNKNEIDYIENTKCMLDFIMNNYPQLSKAVERYELYSNFREMRILLQSTKKNDEYEDRCWKYIKEHRFNVLCDKNAPQRDKFAIICSFFGKTFFKEAWVLYCKFTKR